MKLKYDVSEEELLLELINTTTNSSFTSTDYGFTKPRTTLSNDNINLVNPNSPLTANTAITLYPKNDQYTSEVSFNYRRINLTKQWDVLLKQKKINIDFRLIPEDYQEKKTYIINIVKGLFKINPDKLNISFNFIEQANNTRYQVTIEPNKYSLLYTSNVFVVTLHKLETRFDLSLLDNRAMNGFTYPTLDSITEYVEDNINSESNNSQDTPGEITILGFKVD